MKGLVLEGGGTKGAYQIGAYKALKDLGIEFNGVTGTSIGALNGAYIVQNDIEVMEDIWLKYDYTHFMNIDEESYNRYKNIDFTTKNFNTVIELMNKARKHNGIDISPFKELLSNTINEEIIRNSKKDFGLVTVYWDKKIMPQPMYLEQIPNGRLIDYLIASASLPIFKLDTIDEKLYLDGMFFDNMPISLLEEKGYNDIVVVRLVDDFLGRKNLSKHQNLNITTIIPSQYLGGSLNKDKDSVQKNINLGYLDTMKVFNRYDGIKYYFNVNYKYDEDYCFHKFKNLDEETIKEISNLLGIKREATTRCLMESIIPKVGDILNLDKEFSYKDLFYAIHEKKLEENNINRLRLYDFDKLRDSINSGINTDKNPELSAETIKILSLQKSKMTKLITSYFLKGLKKQG